MFRLHPSHARAVLSLLLGAIGAWLLARGLVVWGDYVQLLQLGDRAAQRAFAQSSVPTLIQALQYACCAAGGIFAVSGLAGWLRHPLMLRWHRAGCWAAYAAVAVWSVVVYDVTEVLAGLQVMGLNESVPLFLLRWEWWSPAWVFACGISILHVASWTGRVQSAYGVADIPAVPAGDAIIEDARTFGRDRRYRGSWLSSLWAHLLLIIIIPWLLSLGGCLPDVKMPKGRGTTAVVVQIKIEKQVMPKKQYIVAKDAPIIFALPEIDDSKVLEDVLTKSEKKPQAGQNQGKQKGNPRGKAGRRGAGGDGPGGWPDGHDDGEFQFYRIEYSGSADWDDGMSKGQADRNFLDFIRKQVGPAFPVASNGKALRMIDLGEYAKRPGRAPPFVFMTGSRSISTSRKEEQAVRDYCLSGGMLFADCGGKAWDGAFRAFINRVFPDYPLVTIAKDDPLFQEPNDLGAEGPAPLWRHGGFEFKGVKYQGRWCVFYHPGDVNDAWKTGGNGLPSNLIENAFLTGDNITNYAVTRYLEVSSRLKKK